MSETNTPALFAEDRLALHNGTYTVSHPSHGHYTIKLHTVLKGNLAGRRIFSLLTGPSNTSDYTAVAFWDEAKRCARVWSKHRAPTSRLEVDGYNWQRDWGKVEKKLSVLLSLSLRDDGGYWGGEGYLLQLEGRCAVCNRALTTPESIDRGIGPECWKRVGAA